MTDCCDTTQNQTTRFPRKLACPSSGQRCTQVNPSTISHHLKRSWLWEAKDQGYYFCADSDCEIVYFGEDGSVIEGSSLRTIVGVKSSSEDDLICYCYGVSLQAMKQDPRIRSFITNKTKNSECACDTRNPSGRCCLKDFPK